MSCPFGHDDAAYVLGALTPGERLEFERHLARCPDCTRSVRELAGIPGLLSRVDPEVLVAAVPIDEPVPHSVLPQLSRAARRARRRRVLTAAGIAAAAAAVVAPVVVSQLDVGQSATTPSTDSPPVALVPMEPVGDVPVVAQLGLEPVGWGTRVELTCTYDTASVPYALPPAVDYVIVVVHDDGHAERVGSWRSIDGKTMRFTAGTAADEGHITSVEVRTVDGRVVLSRTA